MFYIYERKIGILDENVKLVNFQGISRFVKFSLTREQNSWEDFQGYRRDNLQF